jgi:hypothetical protein
MTFALRTGRSLLAVLLAGALVTLGGCSSGPEPTAVAGTAKAAKLKQCVEPTDFIRRNHMELIKHQRDETVHKGVRATKHSLVGCVDCHVQLDKQGRAVPVNAEQQFCDACHEKIGMELTCFACHSPVPNGPRSGGLALQEGYDPGVEPALTAAGPAGYTAVFDRTKGY